MSFLEYISLERLDKVMSKDFFHLFTEMDVSCIYFLETMVMES